MAYPDGDMFEIKPDDSCSELSHLNFDVDIHPNYPLPDPDPMNHFALDPFEVVCVKLRVQTSYLREVESICYRFPKQMYLAIIDGYDVDSKRYRINYGGNQVEWRWLHKDLVQLANKNEIHTGLEATRNDAKRQYADSGYYARCPQWNPERFRPLFHNVDAFTKRKYHHEKKWGERGCIHKKMAPVPRLRKKSKSRDAEDVDVDEDSESEQENPIRHKKRQRSKSRDTEDDDVDEDSESEQEKPPRKKRKKHHTRKKRKKRKKHKPEVDDDVFDEDSESEQEKPSRKKRKKRKKQRKHEPETEDHDAVDDRKSEEGKETRLSCEQLNGIVFQLQTQLSGQLHQQRIMDFDSLQRSVATMLGREVEQFKKSTENLQEQLVVPLVEKEIKYQQDRQREFRGTLQKDLESHNMSMRLMTATWMRELEEMQNKMAAVPGQRKRIRTCNICNKPGHIDKRCPKSRKDNPIVVKLQNGETWECEIADGSDV